MIAKPHTKDITVFHYGLIGSIFLFLLLTIVGVYYVDKEKNVGDAIYPNVFIDGESVNHLSRQQIKAKYKPFNDKLNKSAITVIYQDNPIATFSAKQLNIRLNNDEIIDRAYLIGRSPHTASRFYQKVATLLNLQKYYFDTEVLYDKGTLNEYNDSVIEKYNKPARNALFTFENGKVTTFREHENGLKVKTNELLAEIDKNIKDLRQKPEPRKIVLHDEVVKPEISLSEANNFGIEELIGEGQSDYTHSIPERIHNLTLAASKFNGVIIPKDKVISFVDIVGDISANTGYKPAYVIQNGKTVLGDGGGVCQVSTTLFRAALRTGLPIVARTAHAYRVGYYENDSKPGFDATIFSPSVDLKIKNDTGAAILIQTEIDEDNNLLTFKLYGKKDDRTVELSDATVYDVVGAPPPVYQDDPTLPKGVTKQVDFAAGGAKAKFTYKVHKGGKTVIDETYYSVYRPWAAVFLVGQKE